MKIALSPSEKMRAAAKFVGGRLQGRPLTVSLEVTKRCNARCDFCDYWKISDRDEMTDFTDVVRRFDPLVVVFTGGEPMLRRDLVELCGGAREAGLYSSLITAGTLLTRERAAALKEAGLDHVQISIQSPNPEENDRIAGNRSFEKKITAARAARELDFPLTINCVLHRQNLDRIEELLDLTIELGAQRLELANTQYYGWAVPNQEALLPTWEQLRRGEEAVKRFRDRVGPTVDVLWVLPDLYEDLPKPCMGGWGRTAIVVAPNGDVLPCQAASTIPGLEFASVREHSLEWIWNESEPFTRFRGTGWMQEPCRSCPLGRQEVDWGGCRCQALRLTGDPAAADPVCRLSPYHEHVVSVRESAQTDEFVYRTMKRPTRPSRRRQAGPTIPI